MASPTTPEVLIIAALNGLGNIDFGKKMARAQIRIVAESTVAVYVKFDGVPASSPANGQFTLDATVPAYNEGDIDYQEIGFYSTGVARIEVVGYQAVEGRQIR